MFINKRDLDNLENKLRAEFNGKIIELRQELTPKPRQKNKKVVD